MANTTRIIFPTTIPTLESSRLILSEITENDAEEYYLLCSDPLTMRLWGTSTHTTPTETKELISYLHQKFLEHQMIRWGIRIKGNNHLIGDIGFWRFIFPRDRAEIGAKLHHSYWNQGIVTEALRVIIDFAFKTIKLHSIEANVDPTNIPSLRTISKCGFEQEGYIKEHTFCPYSEQYKDTLLFSLRGGANYV